MKLVTARVQYELASARTADNPQVAERQPAENLLVDPRRVDPDYFTGIHEFGHALDWMGGTDNVGAHTRTRQQLEDVIRDQFAKEHPGLDEQELGSWLRNQLPGGAFQGNADIPDFAGMDTAEGIAHAFTEGELNPQANELSRRLHDLVVQESRPVTSPLLKTRMDNTTYRDSWERQYGPYPGHDPGAPAPEPKPMGLDPDVPWGLTDSVLDMRDKYPQADIGSLGIDEDNTGGVAFVMPDSRTSFEPGKPSVTRRQPNMQIERQWVEAPLKGPGSWTNWMDSRTDEGFFPRWQSTTAGEPWPEDQIDDFVDERHDLTKPKTSAANPANRTNPAELSYGDLLWMNQVMSTGRTPEEQAYSAALEAELQARSEQHLLQFSANVFADPDGAGVWRIGVNSEIEFFPRP